MSHHIVLVGGGHAHVQVLASFAMRPEPGVRLTLVTPHPYATYSGMVPGVLAGQYDLRDAQIDVQSLAARAGATFVPDFVVGIEPAAHQLRLANRSPIPYDVTSFDIGSQPALQDRVAGDAPAAMVKPIDVAARDIEALLGHPAPAAGRRVVVVGAGAGGTEIAFGLRARLREEPASSVTLLDRGSRPVAERHSATSRLVEEALGDRGIDFVGGAEVEAVDRAGVQLADGRSIGADLVVWATGASGPSLFSEAGLPVDARGFLLVGDDLRCVEQPDILGAGDCITMRAHPTLAKAGVYAVRQGPTLTDNLRALANGRGLESYKPQSRFLSLLNCGDQTAIASYGALAWRGRRAWRLKDWIDRRFIEKFARPALDEQGMGGAMAPCGGCAAKLGADTLREVLARLDWPIDSPLLTKEGARACATKPWRSCGRFEMQTNPSTGIVVGIGDDAAVFQPPNDHHAIVTADLFPPFSPDLHLVGRVAAVNALSDLYAMGAESGVAVALVSLPDDGYAAMDLETFLQGALRSFGELGIHLVGGHTVAGEQTLLGFSIHGWAPPETLLRNDGARPGDRLVLSKPLGTGVLMAAGRAGVADADWLDTAFASMLRPNRGIMRLLRKHGATACTDVTGFGLAGHARELAEGSGAETHINVNTLPALPGAEELLAAGWRSSFHGRDSGAPDAPSTEGPSAALMRDPQTSGGLLAAVPNDRIDALMDDCRKSGEPLWIIGEVRSK